MDPATKAPSPVAHAGRVTLERVVPNLLPKSIDRGVFALVGLGGVGAWAAWGGPGAPSMRHVAGAIAVSYTHLDVYKRQG